MKAPRLVPLILVLFAASVGGLFAQQQPAVAPGVRVRVWAPSLEVEKLAGDVSAVKPDTLVITVQDRDASLVLPLASVTKLEVSQGKKSNFFKGFGIGFLFGAAFGAVFGLASGDETRQDFFGTERTVSAEEQAVTSAIGFGVVFGLVGGLFGVTSPSERWQEVPLDQIRLGLTPHGAFSVSVSISL